MTEPHPHQVLLVRHGATDWSQEGRHTGWTDVPLNAEGLRQAAALAPRLAQHTFATVLCSPLRRALTTCEHAGLSQHAEPDPDLREWHYGDYEGLTTAEIRARSPGWNLWADGVRGGETLEQLAARADRVVERLRSLHGDVAVVAHGHLLRVLAARWLGEPAALAQHLDLSTASLSTLAWEHEWPSITLWNDAGHLRGSG
ncbi:MAG: histidine phosphatase family protein [Candidatus Dormibacteria bacterium]